jgi:putative NADPH-quinone reductase
MQNILVISGHTDLQDSVANRTILEELQLELPEADFLYLDQAYPDFKIDVKKEQARLMQADVIVFQFPIFWYAIPSLLQRYLEEVFQYGFSHGDTGDKLQGKRLIASFTTGGTEKMCTKDGLMGFDIDEFLPSLQATANLCGMEWGEFVYTGGVSYQMRNDQAAHTQMITKAKDHAKRVVTAIAKRK